MQSFEMSGEVRMQRESSAVSTDESRFDIHTHWLKRDVPYEYVAIKVNHDELQARYIRLVS